MTVRIVALIGAVCALLLPTAAAAYIGPGAGASLAGSLLGVLAAIFLALAIVLFWPLRLIYRKIRGNKRMTGPAEAHKEADTPSTGTAE